MKGERGPLRQLFETGKCKRFATIANVAVRKLAQLDAAETLELLRAPGAPEEVAIHEGK